MLWQWSDVVLFTEWVFILCVCLKSCGGYVWQHRAASCVLSESLSSSSNFHIIAIWASRLIDEVKFAKVNMPMHLCGDNVGTLRQTKTPEQHKRTKHIDVQYHYIREVVADGQVEIKHVPSGGMVADIFTKPLSTTTLEKFRNMLEIKKVEE